MSNKVRITLVRSYTKGNGQQRKILDGLGLKKVRQSREHADTPAIRGMIAKVDHLVEVDGA
ncbi:MAG: 50S ribosomal protein L30 [Myxococcota bacterium]